MLNQCFKIACIAFCSINRINALFNVVRTVIDIDQLCPTEIAFRAQKYVTILTRTAH